MSSDAGPVLPASRTWTRTADHGGKGRAHLRGDNQRVGLPYLGASYSSSNIVRCRWLGDVIPKRRLSECHSKPATKTPAHSRRSTAPESKVQLLTQSRVPMTT